MTSLFSRRHYEAIAATMLAVNETLGDGNMVDAATAMADLFQGDNPRFDRTRFLEACGLSE
jgi:hypothetical protein